MFLKINVFIVLMSIQICEFLCDQAGAIDDLRNTGGVETSYKESGAFEANDRPSYSAPVSLERGEYLELLDQRQDGPFAFQDTNNLDFSRYGRRKRCQENYKEACPSCTTPKAGKHRRGEENKANLYPTLVRSGEINQKLDAHNVCPSCPSPVEKKPSDENVCPTCMAPFVQNENACSTGLHLEKRGEQDVNSDMRSESSLNPDAALSNQIKRSPEDGQQVCPTCSTLLENGLAVCPSCLAASTLTRLKREARRAAAHFGRQKQLDHHKARKRQNRIEHEYRRSLRPSRSRKLNMRKRKTVNDSNDISVESLLDKDREIDLYQSFGQLVDKDNESGFDARSRVRTHRLSDSSEESIDSKTDDSVNDTRGDQLTADEDNAPGYEHSVSRAKNKRKCEESHTGKLVWDQWGKWSSCAATCGKGNRVRWRHCIAGACSPGEKEAQIKKCCLPPC